MNKAIQCIKHMRQINFRGQLLIELLLAIGLSAIVFPGLVAGIMATRDGRSQQRERLVGLTYFKEANEAIRSIRERGWSNLYGPGTYYPVLSGDGKEWELATGSATINGFTTSITISEVYRSSQAIVLSPTPGINDPSTKRAVIRVSWIDPFPSSIESTIYLTRFLENDSYTETTEIQFDAGVLTGTTVQATNPPLVSGDGEVVLGSGGNSDWCAPDLIANTLDLPGSGYASAITAIEGKAFAGTGENASGLSFMGISVTNTTPPTSSFISNFDGHKTNGVFGEANYGYITTDTNSKELVIIDISTSTYSETGYFNAPGNSSGKGVFVLGDVGYMTSGNKLYNFDLSSKSGSRSMLDSDGVTLAGAGGSVQVVGDYAFVATANTSNDLQIIDVSNPSNMNVVGSANVNGAAAKDLFVASTGNRVYLATGTSSSQNEVFIIDTSTKTGSRPTVGNYDTTGMDPKGITVVPGNRLIVVGNNGEEYQVVNIADESSLQKCGAEEVNAGVNDVASVLESDGDAYSYIVTGDSSSEFKILAGGPGGSYASSGTFESATFNPGYSTANNRFSATYNQPANTSIQFQVSLAELISGTCPTTGNYTFIGPDGTPGTFYTPVSGDSVPFPLSGTGNYSNPGQCFRYKVYMTSTNQNSTPVLSDFTINYSP